MEVAELEVKVNTTGLEALGDFLDKYGDKIKLVGSFEFKKGDVLFFKSTNFISSDVSKSIADQIKGLLPDVKVILLGGIDLIGVGKAI